MSIKVPNKEYLKFNSENSKDDVENLIYRNAESELYRYKDLFIDPPRSLLPPICEWIDNNLFVNEKAYRKEICKSGGSVEFEDDQLTSIARTGAITVPSCIFRDKTYKWTTRSCFIKGSNNIKDQFWKDLSKVVYLVKVTLRDRICSDEYSVKSSLLNIYRSFYQLIDLLVGLPHTNSGNIEKKLEDEMLQYLSCELRVSSETKGEIAKYWDYFEHLSCLPRECTPENIDLQSIVPSTNKHPAGFFIFMSPENQVIDLRLINAFVEDHCRLLIREVLHEEEMTKKASFHEELVQKYDKIIQEMMDNRLTTDQIRKAIQKLVVSECFESVFERLRQICIKHSVPDSIYEMLTSNFKFSMLCEETRDEFEGIINNFQLDAREKLNEQAPLLSLMPAWKCRQVSQALRQYIKNNELTPYHLLLEKCRTENLFIHEYFLHRIIKFIRIREKVLREQLQKNFSFPDKTFRIELELMLPELWTVGAIKIGINKFRYTLNTKRYLECHTNYAFWRLWLFVCHLVQLIISFSQITMVVVPFRSRCSFTALFRRKMHDTKYTVNQDNGQMMSYQGDQLPTLYSRVVDLNHTINEQPNRCNITVIISYIRLLFTCLGLPIVNITVSCLSILIGLFIPLWVPLWTILLALYSCFVFDTNSIGDVHRYFPLPTIILYKFFVSGFVNLCVEIMAILLIPLVALLMVILGSCRVVMRTLYDFMMFHLVLKNLGRTIPLSNQCNWFYDLQDDNNRTTGPDNIILQPEQIIILYLYKLDLLKLTLWHETMQRIARQPLKNYEKYVAHRYGNLGMQINWDCPHIKAMMRDQTQWLDTINKLYFSELSHLNVPEALTKLKHDNRIVFKLTSKQLQVYKALLEMVTKEFYDKYLKPTFSIVNKLDPDGLTPEEMWWKERTNTDPYEFRDLVLVSLKQVFGDDILIPIDFLKEQILELEVSDSTFVTFAELLYSSASTTGIQMTSGDEMNNNSRINVFSKRVETFIQAHIKSVKPLSFQKQRDLELTLDQLKSSLLSPVALVKEDRFFFHRVVSDLPQQLTSFSKVYKSVIRQIMHKRETLPLTKCNIDLYRMFKLHHPLIICLLHHLRDRDNNMLDLSHPLVRQIMSNSINKLPSSTSPNGTDYDNWLSVFMNTVPNDQWNSQEYLLDSMNRRPSHVTNENSNYSLDDGLISNSDMIGSSTREEQNSCINSNMENSYHSNGTKMLASIHSCLGLDTSNALLTGADSSGRRVGASEPLLLENMDEMQHQIFPINKSYPVL